MQTQKASLTVASSVLRDGQTIPQRAVYDKMGCSGGNQSPDLSWSGAPPGTKSFAVTVFDPDAPTGNGFVHWVLFDIPASVTSLEAGAGARPDAGLQAKHGTNDFGSARYEGPCPPPGDPPHHYHFAVYALDVAKMEGLDRTTSHAKFKFMSREHVLASGEIVGLYSR